MTIRDRIAAPSPTLSFELYPPRTPGGREALVKTVVRLKETRPDFVSVTYGASGSTRDSSREVVRDLSTRFGIPPLAHLTCISASRTEIAGIVDEFLAEGVRGFLALRGDPPQGESGWSPHPDGLRYAYELVALIREVAGERGLGRDEVSIGVAASPATYADGGSRSLGLEVLLAKQEAGADFVITQVFFEADHYLDLAEDARAAGIHLPLLPGVIPLPNPGRAARLERLTGVVVPPSLVKALEVASDDDSARAMGVAFAAEMGRTVLDAGAPGIHVYTFNRYEAALELVTALGLGGADVFDQAPSPPGA